MIRCLKGKLLIVLKHGPYNHITQTDDGRHNNCSIEEFRKYICVLNPGAEKSFSSDLEKVDSYLKEAPDLCDKYKKYTDTERIVQYLRKKDNTQSEPLYMISFLDACADCEKEIAENTNEKAITILISVCPFKDSRTRERPEDQTNQNFIQIQLP